MTSKAASPEDIGRWRANLQGEVDGSAVYVAMALALAICRFGRRDL